MGLFSFLRKKGGSTALEDAAGLNGRPQTAGANGISHGEHSLMGDEKNAGEKDAVGINVLFAFLERNHEGRGYDDALVNPDQTHLAQNIESLKNELERTIRRVKTFYEDFINEINFHISSRSRSGMVDTVEELNMKKQIAESHIQKVLEIEADMRNGRGDSQGIIMSYTRGFRNGLAAISHASILKRNL